MNDIQPKRLTRRVIPLDRIEREGDIAAKELAQELHDDMVANAGALDVERLNRGGPQVCKIYMKLLAQTALLPDSPVAQGRAVKPTPPATAKRTSGPMAPASGGPATVSQPRKTAANTARPASVDSTETKFIGNQPVPVSKKLAAAIGPKKLSSERVGTGPETVVISKPAALTPRSPSSLRRATHHWLDRRCVAPNFKQRAFRRGVLIATPVAIIIALAFLRLE